MIDLWRLWAKKQHVQIQFVPSAWPQTIASVEDGTVDIHAGLAKIASREPFLSFTPELFVQNTYVYVNKRVANIHKINDLLPYTIGSIAGSSHINALHNRSPQLKIRTFSNLSAIYQAALNQQILAFADLDQLYTGFDKYQQLATLYPNSRRLALDKISYRAAVKKGNDALLAFVNQGFAKLSLTEKNTIERKWLGLEKDRNVLLLSFSTQLAPYMTISSSGEPQGLFVDLWRLWSKQTGQKIEFIGAETSQTLNLLKQQKADIHIAYPESSTNRTGMLRAWKLYQARSNVFVSTRYPNISSLKQLTNVPVGVFYSAPYKTELIASYPKLIIKYYSNIADMLAAAQRHEIGAMIGDQENLKVSLISANLQSAFYSLENPVFHVDLYSLVSPNNHALAQIIKQGFLQIPKQKMLAIEQKWLVSSNDYYFNQSVAQLTLTKEEQQWRSTHENIRVGIVKNWTPMEFVDQQGHIKGINKDILKLIASRADINFNFHVFDNWQSMFHAIQNDQIDLVGSAEETAERDKNFLFSTNYWTMPWAIIHSKSLGLQTSLQNFAGKRIAVVKGEYLVTLLPKKYPQISVVLVDTPQAGLAAIQKNLADAMLEPLSTATELLKKQNMMPLMLSVIDHISDDHKPYDNQFMLRKNWPELLSILNKGIASLSIQDKQQIYEKWFRIDINNGFNKNVVLRIALQVAIVITLILIFIMLWNRRLHHEVKQRRSLEEQMKHMATHDELTGLANRNLLKERLQNLIALHQRQQSAMAVMFIDLDGFKTINDSYGHDIGDELLVLLTQRLKQCVRQSDTLVRFGGDEFVIVLTGLHTANEATFIAEKIITILKKPFELSVITTCVGCSIGIAMYPDDGETDTELVKVADSLMYNVKAQGKNSYAFSEQNSFVNS